MKLNPSTGNILWSKRLGKATEVNGGFISKWASGEVMLSGYHATDPDDKYNKLLYAKLNATTYAPIWVRLFGGTNDDYGSITKQAGGYLMSGATNSFGPGIPKKYNIFGMLLDANGNYPGCHVAPFSLPVNTKPGVVAANPGLTTTTLQSLTSRSSGAATNINLAVSTKTLSSKAFCSSIAAAADLAEEDEEEAASDVDMEAGADAASDDE